MTERQEQLLKLVIEEYIDSATPIGSQFLAEDSNLGLSAATLRNELRALEEEGYLTHPHTSAGRIPTEFGYRYFVAHLIEMWKPSKQEMAQLDIATQSHEGYQRLKAFAKEISVLVDSAVIVSYGLDTVYYTGMATLFAQPEFRESAQAVQMSALFDHCEERLPDVYDVLQSQTVCIGKENPLGGSCGMVGVLLPHDSAFIILGPQRMRYERALGCLHYISAHI